MSLPKPYYEDRSCTIYHGDCREIIPMLGRDSVDLVLTDPPYGVKNNGDYTRFTGGQRKNAALPQGRVWEAIEGDDEPFDPTPWLGFSNVILWGANNFSDRLPRGSWLVWAKKDEGNFGNFMSDCEVAWSKGGCGVHLYHHTWDGFNRASERGTPVHPSQKPVALMEWCLRRYPKAEVVLDPYMGSGPVAQACKAMGRRYVGIEKVERYCEVAVKRLSQEVLDLGDAS